MNKDNASKDLSGRPIGSAPCTVNWILFDFGGVVAEEGFLNGLSQLAESQNLDPDVVTTAGVELVFQTGFTIGRGREDEFWEALRRQTGLNGQDTEFREVILSQFVLRPWMLDLVRSLKDQGMRCAMLSDQVDWLDRLNERFGFFRAFDRVYNSFHMGKSKREPEVFQHVSADLATPPEGILFIDDSRGNVRRAEEQGWQTILYTDRESFFRELDRFCPDLVHEPPQ
jgi:putative hydrolase of the HAD superfamily